MRALLAAGLAALLIVGTAGGCGGDDDASGADRRPARGGRRRHAALRGARASGGPRPARGRHAHRAASWRGRSTSRSSARAARPTAGTSRARAWPRRSRHRPPGRSGRSCCARASASRTAPRWTSPRCSRTRAAGSRAPRAAGCCPARSVPTARGRAPCGCSSQARRPACRALLAAPELGLVSPGSARAGTGPFQAGTRTEGSLALARNAAWWGSAAGLGPALDSVSFVEAPIAGGSDRAAPERERSGRRGRSARGA